MSKKLPWEDCENVNWLHPMNVEVSVVPEGYEMPDGLRIADEGAVIFNNDNTMLIMECPRDALYILKGAVTLLEMQIETIERLRGK